MTWVVRSLGPFRGRSRNHGSAPCRNRSANARSRKEAERMIRIPSVIPIMERTLARGSHRFERVVLPRLLIVSVVVLNSSCTIVPRERMDECQRVSQTLRSENARLKDQILALQSQNRDYADRAVDDSRRLAIQDEAIDRLEHSVHAYQDERSRLE